MTGALKSRDLTSLDLTTRHHTARVNIERLVSVSGRCSLQVCLIQGVLYELLIGFMFVSSYFCFTYCYVRQTKLASSLDNVWAHYKIVIDCVID